MSTFTGLCRNATTFSKTGELDEQAFRQFLQRFVDAKMGVYIASGGSGEGHALTWEELRRVYQIGVEVCKGKIQVNANPPEQHTARLAITTAQPSALYPELVTVSASGVPGYESGGMQGMFGPAKTPDALVKRLNQEIVRFLRTADAKGKLVTLGKRPSATLRKSLQH